MNVIRGEKSLAALKAYSELLPEWYRSERDTEKTIQKLNQIKELDYYLSNPDEYIRRLAILRLRSLPAKETTFVSKR